MTMPRDMTPVAAAMLGAVINAINTRLDPAMVAFILNHSDSDVFLVDTEFAATVCVCVCACVRVCVCADLVNQAHAWGIRVHTHTQGSVDAMHVSAFRPHMSCALVSVCLAICLRAST
jgi:hypothetical protein